MRYSTALRKNIIIIILKKQLRVFSNKTDIYIFAQKRKIEHFFSDSKQIVISGDAKCTEKYSVKFDIITNL